VSESEQYVLKARGQLCDGHVHAIEMLIRKR